MVSLQTNRKEYTYPCEVPFQISTTQATELSLINVRLPSKHVSCRQEHGYKGTNLRYQPLWLYLTKWVCVSFGTYHSFVVLRVFPSRKPKPVWGSSSWAVMPGPSYRKRQGSNQIGTKQGPRVPAPLTGFGLGIRHNPHVRTRCCVPSSGTWVSETLGRRKDHVFSERHPDQRCRLGALPHGTVR